MKLDTEKLRRKMENYSKVTGKSISSTMRRQARLLAVSLAFNTPPFGKDPSARKQGEAAIGKDLLRIFYVMHPANVQKFLDFFGKAHTFQFGHKGAAAIGNVTHQVLSTSEMAHWHKGHRLPSGRTRNIAGKVGMDVKTITGIRFRDLPGLDVGIVSQLQFDKYVKSVQTRVGMTKAAWAACAIAVKADVKSSLAGIPAWVKRHATKVPHSVTDKTEGSKPDMILTNSLPWADKAMRGPEYKSAIRIAQEKFYRAMSKEIKETLKAAHA
jgi:hypothetical protein